MAKNILKVVGLGKKYRIGSRASYSTLRGVIANLANKLTLFGSSTTASQSSTQHFQGNNIWAIRDIEFNIAEGEVVGFIGKNGAGKSTLFKVLSQITEPTKGYVEINGSLGTLLEVGAGFHPELTGRENIYLYSSILGMRKSYVNKYFDQIVDFSEMEKFLDTPVKHYSSGMYMRLAFSVAAHMDPDILLVDEVLSVGDASFQKKCIGRMIQIAKQGKTILFVSHNMALVKRLCSRAILLHQGKLVADGAPDQILKRYLKIWVGSEEKPALIFEKPNDCVVWLNKISIERVKDGQNNREIDEAIKFVASINVDRKTDPFYFAIAIKDAADNIIILMRDVELNPELRKERQPGCYRYQIIIPPNVLVPGIYRLEAAIINMFPVFDLHRPDEEISFEVIDTKSPTIKSGLSWNSITAIKPIIKYERL